MNFLSSSQDINRIFYYPDKGNNPDALSAISINLKVTHSHSSVSPQTRTEILKRVDEDTLNKDQRTAVEHIFGPLLVLAGAGTGKTRVIIARIARLIGLGVPPRKILAVTFTNKAVKEMTDRAKAWLGPFCNSRPMIKTLHSLCSSIIKVNYRLMGYQNKPEIANDEDLPRFLKRAINSKDDKGNPVCPWYALENLKDEALKEIASKISYWKNNLISPEEAIRRSEHYEALMRKQILEGSQEKPVENPYALAGVYKAYQELLFTAGQIDCDDLLVLAVHTLQHNPQLLNSWQRKFEYIMVDEFQDTCKAQSELLKLMAGERRNICVVGDDDQSIYAFRAADVTIIRDFPKEWEGCEVVKLTENYRCTKKILEMGNKLMRAEIGRFVKELFTNKIGKINSRTKKEIETIPKTVLLEDEHDEAYYIANTIKAEVKNSKEDFSSFAVLIRDQYKLEALEKAFQDAKIPYDIWISDNQQLGEIKQNVYSLLSVIHDPVAKDHAFMALLEKAPNEYGGSAFKLSETDYNVLLNAVDRDKVPGFWAAINSARILKIFSEDGREKLKNLAKLIEILHKRSKNLTNDDTLTIIATEAISELYPGHTNGKTDWPKQKKPGDFLLTLQDIVGYIESWESGAKNRTFNAYLGWNKRLRILAKQPKREQGSAVVISTLHAAKGLEFKWVFLACSMEGIIPTKYELEKEANDPNLNNPKEFNSSGKVAINEARRLFYVGITRAMENLTITLSRLRKVGRQKKAFDICRFIFESGADQYFANNDKPRPDKKGNGMLF